LPTARHMSSLALILAAVGPLSATADGLADLQKASDTAHAVVRRALVEEDGSALASVFTENGAVISPTGQVVRGRTTIRASAILLLLTMGGGEMKISRQDLHLIDSTGYETGLYTFRKAGESKDRVWTGHYTAIWEKEDSQWKVARAIGLR